MAKYIIEGNINFYDELYKSDDHVDDNLENSGELCLISNTPLTKYSVKLDCGHSFNYKSLYNDIVNHKKKYNNMERKILDHMQIRCPYCRKIQYYLLPYYEELGLKKVHGVNFVDETKIVLPENVCNSYKWHLGICCFEMNDSSNNMPTCSNKIVAKFDHDCKKYCYHHTNILNKKIMLQKKIELKEKANEAKLKYKIEMKQKKELLKENLKKQKLEEKLIEKIKTSIYEDNVIVSNTSSLQLCSQILKTGVNKGNPCGCKVFYDNLCKRHYNLSNKSTKTEIKEQNN